MVDKSLWWDGGGYIEVEVQEAGNPTGEEMGWSRQ